jgi:hypothetical protein
MGRDPDDVAERLAFGAAIPAWALRVRVGQDKPPTGWLTANNRTALLLVSGLADSSRQGSLEDVGDAPTARTRRTVLADARRVHRRCCNQRDKGRVWGPGSGFV